MVRDRYQLAIAAVREVLWIPKYCQRTGGAADRDSRWGCASRAGYYFPSS
jgi:hypothetical protein